MASVGFVCVFVVVIAVAAIAIATSAQQSRALNDSFQSLASLYGGDFHPGTIFHQRPSVHFVYHGARVLVDLHSTGGKSATYYTEFKISWPNRRLRCEIYPEHFFSGVSRFFGMCDIEIGSPGFDRDYIISGNNDAELRQLLSPAVQAAIERLRHLHVNDIYVLWSGGTLLIKKRGILRHAHELREFVRLCIDLFDQAAGMHGEGIEFVERPGEPASGEAVCQICGELIEHDQVNCRSCQTPHHRDCWEYYGACSTYGCGQTKFALPRQSKGRAR